MTKEDFELAASHIQSLGTDRHSLLMYGLCRWLNVTQAVEVGPCFGKCSVWIARAIQENGGGKLTVIDDFSLMPQAEGTLMQNIESCGVSDTIEVLKADSQKLERFPSCEFAFIDGDHSYEGCYQDVLKSMAAGARCVVLHDTNAWWGPREFIETVRGQGFQYECEVIEANHDEGLAVLMRREAKPGEKFSGEMFPAGRI